MKTIKAYKTVNLKDGGTITKGEAFTLMSIYSDRIGKWKRESDGRELMLKFSTLIKSPSVATMERWSNDGVAKSVLGARVEPDGHGPYAEPSWMLALGMI